MKGESVGGARVEVGRGVWRKIFPLYAHTKPVCVCVCAWKGVRVCVCVEGG